MRLLDFLGGNTDCLFESYNSSSAYDLFEDYGNLKSTFNFVSSKFAGKATN